MKYLTFNTKGTQTFVTIVNHHPASQFPFHLRVNSGDMAADSILFVDKGKSLEKSNRFVCCLERWVGVFAISSIFESCFKPDCPYLHMCR